MAKALRDNASKNLRAAKAREPKDIKKRISRSPQDCRLVKFSKGMGMNDWITAIDKMCKGEKWFTEH